MFVLADVGLVSGHPALADWLFLIAAIVFAVAAIWPHVRRAEGADGHTVHVGISLVPAGLCLLAVAWLVL